MSKHVIDKKELEGSYETRTELWGCHGRGVSKSVNSIVDHLSGSITYEVVVHHEQVFHTGSVRQAVEIYNEKTGE